MSDTPCPGAGQKWRPAQGKAVCPVCHRGAASIGATTVRQPRQWHVMKGKTVPDHNVWH